MKKQGIKEKEILSESQFVRRQLWFLLCIPITIFKIIAKKADASELSKPLSDIWDFITAPKVTFGLIAVNTLVFFFEVFYFTEEQLLSFVFQPGQLLQFKVVPMVVSLFLHASLAHLAANMVALFIFGRIVEKELGSNKMFFVYFGSAIISSIFSAIFGEGGIGASGAISGIIAMAILYKPFYITYIALGMPIPVIIIGWLSIIADITGILVPKNDNIGHFAHMGGYLAVTALAFMLDKEDRKKMAFGAIINIIFVLVVGIGFLLLS